MKKLFIISALLLLAAGCSKQQANEAPAPSPAPTAVADCNNYPKYFIIPSRPEGDGILVKYKTDPNQTFACSYDKRDGDFEITEQAAYFAGLANNFLILDQGTGPDPRNLLIYDLDQKTKIFTDSYSGPLSVEANELTYWTSTATSVTNTNCPKLNEYSTDGLGAVIETHISLSLPGIVKKDLKETRCSPIQ